MALHTNGMNGAATLIKASTKTASKATTWGGIPFIGYDILRRILSLMVALYQFLKDYLNHFGVLLTAIVIVLACSLRGEAITLQNVKYSCLFGFNFLAV